MIDNNSFKSNYYGHIITGDLNMIYNERSDQFKSKGPKHLQPKQICLPVCLALAEIQTSTDELIERISNDKDINQNHFSGWKSHFMSSEDEKVHTLKNEVTYRSVKSIFSEHEVKNIKLKKCFPLRKIC